MNNRRCRFLAAAFAVFAAAFSYDSRVATAPAYAGLMGNCPGAIPDDEGWDNWAINECLAAVGPDGGDVILDEGAYLINETLNLTKYKTRLVGTTNGAVLQATSGLYGRILIADWVDEFVIENIRFYGNKGERGWRLWECTTSNNNRDFAKNVLLKGNGFVVRFMSAGSQEEMHSMAAATITTTESIQATTSCLTASRAASIRGIRTVRCHTPAS